jgi:hypothetical protein
MANTYGKKTYVGKVMKGQDGKADYIVINEDITLKKGEFLKLESKAARLAELQQSFEAGRLKEDKFNDLYEKASKAADSVRFTIIHQVVTKNS